MAKKKEDKVKEPESMAEVMSMTCGDCGVDEGMYHEWGCDMEPCPFCDWQLISCDCARDQLSVTEDRALTASEDIRWRGMVWDKGRIRWIHYPLLCCRCGEPYPDMFMVADKDWYWYVQPEKRGELLCRPCFDWIKAKIDAHSNTKEFKVF